MEILTGQATMYDALKRAFSPPDEVLVQGVVDGSFAARIQETVDRCCSLTARCCLPAGLMEEIHGISSSLEEESESGDLLETLNVEYMWLFVNAFPNLWSPPYESYYREGRTIGRAAMECLAVYQEMGLAMAEEGELPDHIVTQLEYLHFLCIAQIGAVEQGDRALRQILSEKKQKFYEQHIIHWVPEFCGRIRSHSRATFYSVMSRLLKNFTILENRSLNTERFDLYEEVGHNEVKRA
jgi:TorA maturation chaperone TorD